MSVDTMLIFGIHTTTNFVLKVTGSPSDPAPPLLIQNSQKEESIAYNNGAWETQLLAGDNVVRIEGKFSGAMAFSVPPDSIIYSCLHNAPPIISWTVTDGTITVNDSKDPWPPPATPVGPGTSDWLATTLEKLRKNITIERSLPSGAMPARTAK